VKLLMSSLAAARKKLSKLKAKFVRQDISPKDGRVHELNVLFDTPDGGFARHGQLLRLRIESRPSPEKKGLERVVLTYKGPAERQTIGRYKIRQENEVVVASAQAMRTILEALGLRGWFRYEKFRTSYALPSSVRWATGLQLDLDETPIGTYLELEGPEPAIDRAARELGYSPSDYITKDYLMLHVEHNRRKGVTVHQLAPGIITGIPDMVFPR
jgi:adenylate cyclase class 2